MMLFIHKRPKRFQEAIVAGACIYYSTDKKALARKSAQRVILELQDKLKKDGAGYTN